MRNTFSSALRATVLSALIAVPVLPAAAQTFGSNEPSNSVLFGRDMDFGAFGALAQTFVVPDGSPVLEAFTFSFSNGFFGGGDLRFRANVFAFDTDRIVGDALYISAEQNGSETLEGFDAYLFADVNLTLASGTTYALLLRPTDASPQGSTNLVATSNTNTFALGALFLSNGTTDEALGTAGAFTPSTGADDSFGEDAALTMTFGTRKTTVPEPASVLLLVAGLGMLAGRTGYRAIVRR